MRPPKVATRLLERLLPVDERTELIGDLDEEFDDRAARLGAFSARAWYWRQTWGLVWNARALSRGMHAADAGPRLGLLEDAASDWRLASRMLCRSPAFSVVALLSIVLSLGLATAVFSIVNGILLKPLPFATADGIVRLGATLPIAASSAPARVTTIGGAPAPPRLSDVMVGAWLTRRDAVEAIAPYAAHTQTVSFPELTVRVSVAEVGGEFFRVLPVQPIDGRSLQPTDAAITAPAVALVSQRLAQQVGGVGRSIAGETIQIADRPYEVVGVLPQGFEWPHRLVDVWTVDKTQWPAPEAERQFGRSVETIGLLRVGATPEQARAEGQRIADELVGYHPSLDRSTTAKPVVVVHSMNDELIAPARPALLLLILGTLGVVVAANVNLAGLILSRNTARQREVAVRRALGASRWRLVRPLLFEQLIIGGLGACGAGALAWATLRFLPTIAPADLPRLSAVSFDLASLAFAVTSSLLLAVLVGLMPALRVPSTSLRAVVSDGGSATAGTSRDAERTRGWLVACQVALATVLLVGTALVGRSLLAMLRVDPGYRADGVLTFQIGTAQRMSRQQPGRLVQIYDELQTRLRSSPQVLSVGTSTALPLHGDTLRVSVSIPGLPAQSPPAGGRLMAHVEVVGATYFETIGARLTRGRFFEPGDAAGNEPVAIVNEAFVRVFLPGVEPLGQTVPFGSDARKIVGVIGSVRRGVTIADEDQALYLPAAQIGEGMAYSAGGGMGVAVRTTGDPNALIPAVRSLVRELDASAPVFNMMPLADRLNGTFATPRFYAVALALFAALALATALLGVYGVVAYSVERRRIEFGVRRALGATTAHLIGCVFGRAARLVSAGLVVGLITAVAGAGLMRSLLFGIQPIDVLSYALAVGLVGVAILPATWLPARRALRIDPARVLRED